MISLCLELNKSEQIRLISAKVTKDGDIRHITHNAQVIVGGQADYPMKKTFGSSINGTFDIWAIKKEHINYQVKIE